MTKIVGKDEQSVFNISRVCLKKRNEAPLKIIHTNVIQNIMFCFYG